MDVECRDGRRRRRPVRRPVGGVTAPEADDHRDTVESIVLGEDDRGFVAISSFEPEDLRLALADCRRRERQSLGELTQNELARIEGEIAFNEHRIDLAESLLAHELSFIDHREGSVLGRLTRREWVGIQSATISQQAQD